MLKVSQTPFTPFVNTKPIYCSLINFFFYISHSLLFFSSLSLATPWHSVFQRPLSPSYLLNISVTKVAFLNAFFC